MWGRGRRGRGEWRGGRTPGGRQLVGECRAFLAGRYAERLVSRQVPVPPWAWMNRLAHGSMADIRATDARLGARRDPERWGEARAYLAGEVLAAAGDDPEVLTTLQRDVLVPIELEVASTPTCAVLGPGCVVSRVLSALDAYRRSRATG